MLLGLVFILRTSGCEKHTLTDYRPLDQAGMWSSSAEQLKKLNTSDDEVAQLVKLKQAGITDDACVTLVTDAHQHEHPFASADSAINLSRAGYAEPVILEIAKTDRFVIISPDAVILKWVGFSNSSVDMILHRRLKGKNHIDGEMRKPHQFQHHRVGTNDIELIRFRNFQNHRLSVTRAREIDGG